MTFFGKIIKKMWDFWLFSKFQFQPKNGRKRAILNFSEIMQIEEINDFLMCKIEPKSTIIPF